MAAFVKPFLLSSPLRAILVSLKGHEVVPSGMCWWLRDPWSSLAPNDLLSVLTSLWVKHQILHAL